VIRRAKYLATQESS